RGDVCKTTHTASDIEHEFSREVLRAKAGASPEGSLRTIALLRVQLCSGVHVPLKTKAASVLLRIHKANDAFDVGILAAAFDTHQLAVPLAQSPPTGETNEYCQHFVSDLK